MKHIICGFMEAVRQWRIFPGITALLSDQLQTKEDLFMTVKNIFAFGLTIMAIAFTFGCNTSNSGKTSSPSTSGNSTGAAVSNRNAGQTQNGGEGNILIAYFSTNGVVDTSLIDPSIDAASQASIVIPNMALVAAYINENIGGAMFAIRTVKKYPAGMNELNAMGYAERDADARPELSTHVENMDAYNTIYLCYPNWCGTIPMAVATFLEEYDFSGKTIIASCTHFGSGFGNSIRDIEKLCPDARIMQGYNGSGRNVRGDKGAVVNWLRRIGAV
jgi:flavodoxin